MEFVVGDVVRVKDPDCLVSPYNKKCADRDGVVTRVFDVYGGVRLKVLFGKRGNRGKEFSITVAPSTVVKAPVDT